MTTNFTLFETAIGTCGIGWTADGIVCTQLPEPNASRTAARMRQRLPGAITSAPPPAIAAVIARIVALLAGGKDDLADIPLELDDLPEFNRKVYAIARAIPPGETLSYGDIAKRLGNVALSREVGQALGKNPFPVIVPCHRVLAAGARPGGFSAPGGPSTKLKMLAIEGAYVNHTPSLFDAGSAARARG